MRVSGSIVLFIWLLSAAGCISFEATKRLALKYEDLLDFDNSIKYYEKMWYRSKDPEIAKSLALIYLKRREYSKAVDWYAVYNSLSILKLEDHFNNAEILIGNGKYLEAKFHLEKIREKSEEEMYSDLWQSYYRTVTEAPDILMAPTMYELHPFTFINTPYSDFGYSANGNKKFFISDKLGNKSSKKERYGWTGNAYLKVYEGEWNKIGEEFKHHLAEDFIYKFHVGPIFSNSRFQFITINEEAAIDKGKKISDGQKVGPKIIYRDKEGPLPFKRKQTGILNFKI
ncbi:tetratricopeptide repeat protein [Pantanalinema rosaneae CENA516]|uniref:tetratricopeptide repeat protein n=1 Tax=Pantanalinema rosaneae TaxID=1620701 RepID=UPI003D70140D